MRVIRHATIDSTNLEARRLSESGEPGPLWILGAEQTSGLGRLGRQWVSKPGNFYGTLVWPTAAQQSAYMQLGFVAALAVAEASRAFADESRIRLKWPNDCLLEGAKFCGILAEVLKPGLIAIGIGVNIAHAPEGLAYPVARLSGADVDSFFKALAASLEKNLEIWDEGKGFTHIRERWLALCAHANAPVEIDGEQGTFAGLAADGAFLFKTVSGTRPIYAGDVRLLYQGAP